jgi:hypothetical protein
MIRELDPDNDYYETDHFSIAEKVKTGLIDQNKYLDINVAKYFTSIIDLKS